jgi:hypothetical protein
MDWPDGTEKAGLVVFYKQGAEGDSRKEGRGGALAPRPLRPGWAEVTSGWKLPVQPRNNRLMMAVSRFTRPFGFGNYTYLGFVFVR